MTTDQQHAHQRIRIIRRVEAIAAADLSGTLPWHADWEPVFGSPDELVEVLRSRQQHTAALATRRRTQRGVDAILREHAASLARRGAVVGAGA